MTIAPPACNCLSPLRDMFPDRGCPIHGTKATHDRLMQAERARDRLRAQLEAIRYHPMFDGEGTIPKANVRFAIASALDEFQERTEETT